MEWLWVPLLFIVLVAIVVTCALVRAVLSKIGEGNTDDARAVYPDLPTRPRGRPQGVIVGPPRPIDPGVRGPVIARSGIYRGAPLRVPAHAEGLWAEKGWQHIGRDYVGQWVAGGRRWPGRIEQSYPGGFGAYIWHPPLDALEHHPHRPCFRPCGPDGQHEIHFRATPQSVDHLITNVEVVLSEAVGGRR